MNISAFGVVIITVIALIAMEKNRVEEDCWAHKIDLTPLYWSKAHDTVFFIQN